MYHLIGILGVTAIGVAFRNYWPTRALAVVVLLYVAIHFHAGVQKLQRTTHMAINDLQAGAETESVEQTLESGLNHVNRVHHPVGLVTVVCLGLLALTPGRRVGPCDP